MTVWRAIIAALVLMGFLSACALPGLGPGPAKPPGEEVDGAPDGTLDVGRIRPVTPRPEPRSPYGNHSPYEVLGQTYHVRPSAAGYRERGIASWYGTKFHGRLTSSGEPYDMHQLTAAHRSLPLPTFAEVTHLGNGRSIIVRINDRGPFHPDRIIDLSWAAAVKLGIDQAGTGPVEVRAITFAEPEVPTVRPASLPVLLQVGAFSERDRADALAATLSGNGVRPVLIEPARVASGRVWRVRVGPLNDYEAVFSATERITALGYQRPQYVYP